VTPEQWTRLRSLFEALCELDHDARERAISELDEPPELLDRLQRMLSADGASRLRDDVVAQSPALHRRVDPPVEPDRSGDRLGPWRITATLGEGGMGRVYRAVRDDGRFEAEAAIKIVSSGVDAARFVNERAVLARLQHPGIARLLDGGECADGRPYLVMELVDGLPLDQHCAVHQLPALARVRLVLAAARAAAYAHARAVLHRDLKPDNVMVDARGEVKLLDFGVAKLLDSESDGGLTSARYFTPRYAAPEQFIDQPVTTATDVFALAVMLHELLTGRHPFSAADGDDELARRVLSVEPTPLRRALRDSGAARGLADSALRDLSAVLAHGLAREPGQRFQSMDAFADELQRVLEDRAVQTRRPSVRERGWRWARTHPTAAAGLLLGLLSLGLGSGTAIWQAREARLQRDAAVIAATRAERVAQFLVEIFRAPNPAQSRGLEVSARDLLDRGRDRIGSELGDDPSLRARMQAVIADTYRSLGAHDEAEALLDQALLTANPESRAALLMELGWLRAFQGRFAESAASLQEAAGLAQLHAQPLIRIQALQRLATPLINLDRLDEAEAAVTTALELHAAHEAHERARAVSLRELLANIAYGRRQLDRAEALYIGLLDAQRALHGDAHVAVSMALNNLGAVALARARNEDAERYYRQAVEVARGYFGVDNAQVGLPVRGLAISLRRQRRGDEALATMREAAAIFSTWSGATHLNAVGTQLDALELAVLLGAPSTVEQEALAPVIAGLPVDGLAACRWHSLVQLAEAQPDIEAARAARDCLEQRSAPETMRLLAETAVQRASVPADSAVLSGLIERANALPAPDPLIALAIAALVDR
jgi:eukaryotic-like serine/threonine-protein kinase